MQDRRSRWTVPNPKVCRTRSGRPSPLLGVPSTRPKPQLPATRWRATVVANLYPSKRQTIHSSAVLPRAAHRCTSMAAAPPDGAWQHGVFVANALRKANLKFSPSLSHDRHHPTPLHNANTRAVVINPFGNGRANSQRGGHRLQDFLSGAPKACPIRTVRASNSRRRHDHCPGLHGTAAAGVEAGGCPAVDVCHTAGRLCIQADDLGHLAPRIHGSAPCSAHKGGLAGDRSRCPGPPPTPRSHKSFPCVEVKVAVGCRLVGVIIRWAWRKVPERYGVQQGRLGYLQRASVTVTQPSTGRHSEVLQPATLARHRCGDRYNPRDSDTNRPSIQQARSPYLADERCGCATSRVNRGFHSVHSVRARPRPAPRICRCSRRPPRTPPGRWRDLRLRRTSPREEHPRPLHCGGGARPTRRPLGRRRATERRRLGLEAGLHLAAHRLRVLEVVRARPRRASVAQRRLMRKDETRWACRSRRRCVREVPS